MDKTYHFSAPGRTEIGGNHTDHQHGRVIAAAVDMETTAEVTLNGTNIIRVDSEGYKPVEIGKTKKPILLKRGIAATMKELLMSAEYIMASGNEQVILCERGIRTYETYTRNTLDLSAVPMLHELSHLPVVVDPSHATGLARLVTPMALAATAGGADGIMVEVHNDPIHALCDGAQSLTPSQFAELSAKVMKVREAVSQ